MTSVKADRCRNGFPVSVDPTHRYDDVDGDLWFDYVADLGDAFDPTMAVAWQLGRTVIQPSARANPELPAIPTGGLPRGRFLVFGGDEVYPYASPARYRNQLVGPYSLAWEGDPTEADVYALPGNHDWYGGLDPWRKVFCSGDQLGVWTTRQQSSWFALALPKGWWLWALDTGLNGSINLSQRAYFAAISEKLRPTDRIILCTPVPLWSLYAKHPEQLTTVDRFVDEIIGTRATTPVFLAGDSHVFGAWQRQQGAIEDLHITSGGGGAFLHPTHHLTAVQGANETYRFHLRYCWPDQTRSKALSAPWHRLLRDRQSRLLLPIGAAAHLFYSRVVWGSIDPMEMSSTSGAALEALRRLLTHPAGWAVMAAIVAASVLSIAPNSKAPAVLRAARRFGLMAGLAQIPVFWSAALLARVGVDLFDGHRPALAAVVAVSFMGSIGSLAAFAALATRGNAQVNLGDNLVFSSHHIEEYKHLVRLRVHADTGALSIYVIGVEQPGTGWSQLVDTPAGPPPEHSEPRYVWGTKIA